MLKFLGYRPSNLSTNVVQKLPFPRVFCVFREARRLDFEAHTRRNGGHHLQFMTYVCLSLLSMTRELDTYWV